MIRASSGRTERVLSEDRNALELYGQLMGEDEVMEGSASASFQTAGCINSGASSVHADVFTGMNSVPERFGNKFRRRARKKEMEMAKNGCQ